VPTVQARDIAARIGAELRGPDVPLSRVASLGPAQGDSLSFLAGARHRWLLPQTRAGAVILHAKYVAQSPCTVLVTENPELAFAKAVAVLHPRARPEPGVHPSAVVHPSARLDPAASVGPLSVIEADVELAAGVEIGPHCVVGAGSRIGPDSRLVSEVVVCERSIIGARVLLHPGSVIGREGFGFARDGDRWVRIPQIGRVRLGDDVEIGANTAVDRGAIEDTVIGDGVKIDNLIQIGHNVSIGEHTAMAACSGISGSTQIGRRCTIAGAVGMAGHLEIGDDVHFTGMAMVTRSQTEPGIYSSGIPAMPNADWRHAIARLKRLGTLSDRVTELEALVRSLADAGAGPAPERHAATHHAADRTPAGASDQDQPDRTGRQSDRDQNQP